MQRSPHISAVVKIIIGAGEHNAAQMVAPQNLENWSGRIQTGTGKRDEKELRDFFLIC